MNLQVASFQRCEHRFTKMEHGFQSCKLVHVSGFPANNFVNQMFTWIRLTCCYSPSTSVLSDWTSGADRSPISSVQSLSRVRLFATPWIAARQATLSITNSQSSPKLTSIELVMPSSHLILCCPLLLLPPVPPSIRVFSNESVLSGLPIDRRAELVLLRPAGS